MILNRTFCHIKLTISIPCCCSYCYFSNGFAFVSYFFSGCGRLCKICYDYWLPTYFLLTLCWSFFYLLIYAGWSCIFGVPELMSLLVINMVVTFSNILKTNNNKVYTFYSNKIIRNYEISSNTEYIILCKSFKIDFKTLPTFIIWPIIF